MWTLLFQTVWRGASKSVDCEPGSRISDLSFCGRRRAERESSSRKTMCLERSTRSAVTQIRVRLHQRPNSWILDAYCVGLLAESQNSYDCREPNHCPAIWHESEREIMGSCLLDAGRERVRSFIDLNSTVLKKSGGRRQKLGGKPEDEI